MEEITGLNPTVVRFNINDFEEKGYGAIENFTSILDEANLTLRELWGSPNAVAFCNNVNPLLDNAMFEAYALINNLAYNAKMAYNSVASAMGLDTIAIDGFGFMESPATFGPGHITTQGRFNLMEKVEDVVGMKKLRVLTEWLPKYKAEIDKAIMQFDNIPTSIALFDESGQQQSAFHASIKSIKTKIASLIIEIWNSIEGKIIEELEAMGVAVQKSVETLNSK